MTTSKQQYRYLAGVPRGNKTVFLSWRLLKEDDPDTPFDVERRQGRDGNWQRVNDQPITDSTNFLDTTPQAGSYQYRVITPDGGVSETIEVDSSAPATLVALSIPMNPDDEIDTMGITLGDIYNDGKMGYIIRAARAGTIWILAFDHDGKSLWEFDTKIPHVSEWRMLHVPVLCWDINSDGRSEVVFRRDRQGRKTPQHEQTSPDETIVAVDAQTGQIVWECPLPGVNPRVNMTVGHLRGMNEPASLVLLDGTYGDVVLTAIAGENGKITWQVKQARPAGHNLDIADIDGDGIQEIICGGICYNGDGTIRWEAEPFGHTDISKPARIDPNREGLQIWYAVESGNPGVYFVDNRGQTIFSEPFRHAHYGWIARHTTEVPGLQPHTAEDARYEYGQEEIAPKMRQLQHNPIFLPDGTHWSNLTDWQRKNFVPVHWDAGPEVVFIIRKENKRIVRFFKNGEIEDLPDAKLPESGHYGRNLTCADVMGDFRENIVALDTDQHRLMVLLNPTLCNVRGYSPFEDFEYRHDRSQHGSGYYIYLSPPDTAVNRR